MVAVSGRSDCFEGLLSFCPQTGVATPPRSAYFRQFWVARCCVGLFRVFLFCSLCAFHSKHENSALPISQKSASTLRN